MSRLEAVKAAEKIVKVLEALPSNAQRVNVINFAYSLLKADYVETRDTCDEQPDT